VTVSAQQIIYHYLSSGIGKKGSVLPVVIMMVDTPERSLSPRPVRGLNTGSINRWYGEDEKSLKEKTCTPVYPPARHRHSSRPLILKKPSKKPLND
jgi:hypothetical protein